MLRINSKAIFATSLILAGLVILVPEAQAAVAFNTFPISYIQEQNHDMPMIDARNVSAGGNFSVDQADHNNGVPANSGDTIEFIIYYHNTGTASEVAHNVTVKATLPGGTRNTHEVSAQIKSDETSTIFSNAVSNGQPTYGGNININVGGSPQTLELISGSTQWFPNRSTTAQALPGGDNLLSSGANIGSLQGCFDFSGFIKFRARVGSSNVTTENTYNLAINKRVLNVSRGDSNFADSTTARPNDRLRFEVRVDTSGNAAQSNVIVRDILPAQLTWQSGTVRQDGGAVGNEAEFFGSGRNLGALAAGSTRAMMFEAVLAGPGAFSGTTTITNTANVRSDQVTTRQDETPITVSIVANTSFVLRKTARNLTQGNVDATTVNARPGDTISYSLFYKNTGNVTISGAVIEDDIHDITELARITNQGGAVSVNGSIRFASVDVPAGVEISRTFEVQVRPVAEWPVGTDQVMVNVYGNEIRVPVERPAVPAAPFVPPRTGAGEWMVGLMAALTTGGYWIYRRKQLRQA